MHSGLLFRPVKERFSFKVKGLRVCILGGVGSGMKQIICSGISISTMPKHVP